MAKKNKIQPKTDLTGHTNDITHHYWHTIKYLNALIKSSELKAGLILSFYGIVLNFIYQSTKNIQEVITGNMVFLVLLIMWIVCTALSIFFCIRCFIPKIEGNYDKNMFFFKDVINSYGSIKDFSKSFFKMSINEDDLFLQLGEQIYIVSKIADWKFKNVKRAINLLAAGLVVLFAIGLYLVYFLYF